MSDPGLISDISDRDNLYLHCGGGVRSIIAASLLKKEGFHNLRNVVGGWKAIQKEKIPTEKETSLSQDAN
jgi:rhodanese-related sulfurtransferase